MLDQRAGRERSAGRMLDKFRCGVPLALPVDLLAEPVPQRLKLAAGELPVKAANSVAWAKSWAAYRFPSA